MNPTKTTTFLPLIFPRLPAMAAAIALSALLLTACQSSKPEPNQTETSPEQRSLTLCQNPRSKICTREYRPVCGQRDTGVRCVAAPCDEATEWKTYGNACTACADEKVMGFLDGACVLPTSGG